MVECGTKTPSTLDCSYGYFSKIYTVIAEFMEQKAGETRCTLLKYLSTYLQLKL